jgi:pilus assembly protein CpaC
LFLCAGAGLQAQTSPSSSDSAAAASQDAANDLSVSVGKTVLVDTTWPIKRVALGTDEIAEVHGTSATEIIVRGKAPGETSLIVWDTHGGRQFFNLSVRPSTAALNDALDSIRRELRTELPGQPLKISSGPGVIYLRGTVKDMESSARAVKIAAAGGKVINLLNVNVPDGDPQILLKVRFISIDRSKETKLGINLSSTGALNTIGSLSTGQFTTAQTNITASPIGNLPMELDIKALTTKIGGQVLAEPNLIAANGKQASFLAGGEFPFPMVQGGSGGAGASITIMFKEYGVRLNFIPTITPRGTIRLQVAPEVSSLDFADEVTISGFTVPAITTRKVDTEVELADGQSFVIGGLLDNTESETYSKIPFLGDIPIIGKFFQSMDKLKANSELIVIVTPEIVAPIPAGEAVPQLKFPTKFLPPNSGIPMNTPDAKTAANTLPPPPQTISIEKLKESMKPETPLVVEGGGTTFGGSSAMGGAAPAAAPAEQ